MTLPGVGDGHPASLPAVRRNRAATAEWANAVALANGVLTDETTEYDKEAAELRPFVDGPRAADIVMATTALVARIVDPTLHPCSIKAEGPAFPVRRDLRRYHGRGMAEKLAQLALESDVTLGNDVPNPFNNGAYAYKDDLYAVVSSIKGSDGSGQAVLDFVERTADLDDVQLRRYLVASVLLGRREWERKKALSGFEGVAVPYIHLMDALPAFVEERSEDGKWGQAFVAAVLETVGLDVRCRGVYISRGLIGDVEADVGGLPLIVEVRQKAVHDGPKRFALSVSEGGHSRATYVELMPGFDTRRSHAELRDVLESTGVNIRSLAGAHDVVDATLPMTGTTEADFAARFPAVFDAWLGRLAVSESAREEWRAVFAAE